MTSALGRYEEQAEENKEFRKQLGTYLARLARASEAIPQPKGMLWWRKCPKCNSKVRKEVLGGSSFFPLTWYYYDCNGCDYEYCKEEADILP